LRGDAQAQTVQTIKNIEAADESRREPERRRATRIYVPTSPNGKSGRATANFWSDSSGDEHGGSEQVDRTGNAGGNRGGRVVSE